MLSILQRARFCDRSRSPQTQGPHSTASTCFRSLRIGFRKSIQAPVAFSQPSRHRLEAVTRGSRGPTGRFGLDSIGKGRFIKSIPTQERFFARSRRIVLSPVSPGLTENSGTELGKAKRAIR